MDNLLRGNIGFCADAYGNVQAVVYPGNIPMIVSPLPLVKNFAPKRFSISDFVYSEEAVRALLQEKNLTIKNQDDFGIQCSGPISYIYFPFKKGGKNIPLLNDECSERKERIVGDRIARILCERVKYLYSLSPKDFDSNPKSFFIVRNSVIDMSERLDDSILEEGRLVVPSKKIRDRLIRFIDTEKANDLPGLLNYNNSTSIDENVLFSSVEDFKSDNTTLVFNNNNFVKDWVILRNITKKWNYINNFIDESANTPYFFSYPGFFNGKNVMINNISSGEIEDALMVCEEWNKNSINLGYTAESNEGDIVLEEFNYRITTNDGYVEEHLNRDNKPIYDLFLYSTGNYASVLSF